MHVIVGLQNPGEEYENTRHNAGALAVRAFREEYRLPEMVSSASYVGELSEGIIGGHDVRILLPTTFMNSSGTAVKKAMIGEPDASLVVVYDDLDIPLGSFKISHGRGSGGHNGVESVMHSVGSKDFTRVRIGIAPVSFFGTVKKPKGERVSKFVLQEFSRRERAKLDAVMPKVVSALHMLVTKGRHTAMTEFN